jgi:hypothetical protein
VNCEPLEENVELKLGLNDVMPSGHPEQVEAASQKSEEPVSRTT